MKRLLIGCALGLMLVGSACGGTQDQPALEQPTPDHNEADVAFAQGMIPHHQQAIEMSDLALSQASSPEVKDLASRIKSAQQPEIDQMTAWLEDWRQQVHAEHGGHGGSGMLSEAEMAQLRQASGPTFDRLFLEGMIRHHEGAVGMAQEELDKGQFREATELARHIIDSQQAEISEMRRLLQR
ncbi:MAG: DUF305 domain-containing protein [Nitriliruptorales bacterium]